MVKGIESGFEVSFFIIQNDLILPNIISRIIGSFIANTTYNTKRRGRGDKKRLIDME